MSILCALVLMASMTILGFVLESWLYRRRLNRIPIRIHVNGTRGKSSVTRLIAAGLRGGGLRTCAKTTGTLARMIFPSGEELPIFRPARANVIEQKRVVRAAVNANAEALVIECMALQPILQSMCELQLVRSTHGVLTNARADHLDVMGPTRLDVAGALAGTMPVAGEFFTAETRSDSIAIFEHAAADRASSATVIQTEDLEGITDLELAKFSYLEHRDNVALSLSVCESLGVDRQAALEAMWTASPDPGAMQVHEMLVADRSRWRFVNAFAANDPESTEQLWETAYDRFPGTSRRVLVMNCRADRPDRSKIMAEAMVGWTLPDQVIVTGTGTDVFVRAALNANLDADRLVSLGKASNEEILEAIASDDVFANESSEFATVSDTVMVMGIGNVAGVGWALDQCFQQTPLWSPARIVASKRAPVDDAQLQTSRVQTSQGKTTLDQAGPVQSRSLSSSIMEVS